MEIALLNVRITFQKNKVAVDVIGNHMSGWEDYYSCYATVSGESGTETSVSGLSVDNSDTSFTVRFCRQTGEVANTGFRILFQGEIYNILSVDHLNYKKKALKFKCQKVRR